MNLWIVFLTGLTTGGITCAAMQGGLLASAIANQKKAEDNKQTDDFAPSSLNFGDWGPIGYFLIFKLVAHIILGAMLGAVGSIFTLSPALQLLFQGAAALFMLTSAMNLLDVHPVFRYSVITPPRFVRKLIRRNSVANHIFAPGILGLFTVLIPCGVTQAMEILAMSTGNPVQGALIMAAFVIGTIPAFTAIGFATAKLSDVSHLNFLRVAALLLIVMSIYSFNGILQVTDSHFSLQRVAPKIVRLLPPYSPQSSIDNITPTLVSGVQQVTIDIHNNGYTPKRFTVRGGTPVELTVKAEEVYSCAAAFTFHAFNINSYIKSNSKQVFNFTPTKKGLYTYSCSMGMYSGTMEVI